jgi:hypothetical protein
MCKINSASEIRWTYRTLNFTDSDAAKRSVTECIILRSVTECIILRSVTECIILRSVTECIILRSVTECIILRSVPWQVVETWRGGGGVPNVGFCPSLTFGTTRPVELSVLRAGRTLLPRIFLGTHFFQRLTGLQGYVMRTEGLGHVKISKNATGSRTQHLPSCGTVPGSIVFIYRTES